ncbi:MAG: hypothetical protein AAFY46_13890, partial [Planctomycetota bacterium]
MALASHSTAAFRVLVRVWAAGDAVHREDAATVAAAVAAAIDARTPGAAFGSLRGCAPEGVHAGTVSRWLDRFGAYLARASDDAGWDGIGALLCNLDPDTIESEAEAWPRVRELMGSSGYGHADAGLAVADADVRRGVLLTMAGWSQREAAGAVGSGCSVSQRTVGRARGRLLGAVERACAAERDAYVRMETGAIGADSTETGEPSAAFGRLVQESLLLAGRAVAGGLVCCERVLGRDPRGGG